MRYLKKILLQKQVSFFTFCFSGDVLRNPANSKISQDSIFLHFPFFPNFQQSLQTEKMKARSKNQIPRSEKEKAQKSEDIPQTIRSFPFFMR